MGGVPSFTVPAPPVGLPVQCNPIPFIRKDSTKANLVRVGMSRISLQPHVEIREKAWNNLKLGVGKTKTAFRVSVSRSEDLSFRHACLAHWLVSPTYPTQSGRASAVWKMPIRKQLDQPLEARRVEESLKA